MATTTSTRDIAAARAAVYRALLDAEDVRHWMVPEGMTSTIHSFDSFHGRFVELVPDTKVVQVVEFETDDPALQGEMTITYELTATADGTTLTGTHENLPPGVSPADNELGWRMSTDKLAALVEARRIS